MSAAARRYKDINKYEAYIQRKKINYRINSGSGIGRVPWDEEQARMAVLRKIPDREIAKLTRHSIEAVQAKRRRLRKGLESIKGYDPAKDPLNPYNRQIQPSINSLQIE